MTRTESTVQVRTFTSYAQHHLVAKNKVLDSIDKMDVAALERCRELAQETYVKLQAKKPGSLDIRALAEFPGWAGMGCIGAVGCAAADA